MTAVATGGEYEGDDALPFTMDRLLEVARQYPYLYFEAWTCEKCKESPWMFHQGAERLVCTKCGQARASQTPRPSSLGDLTLAHYQMALTMLHSKAVLGGDNVGVALLRKVNLVAEGLADLDRH